MKFFAVLIGAFLLLVAPAGAVTPEVGSLENFVAEQEALKEVAVSEADRVVLFRTLYVKRDAAHSSLERLYLIQRKQLDESHNRALQEVKAEVQRKIRVGQRAVYEWYNNTRPRPSQAELQRRLRQVEIDALRWGQTETDRLQREYRTNRASLEQRHMTNRLNVQRLFEKGVQIIKSRPSLISAQ